jgi:ribonuclease P/MRP protein subunit RPP40
MATVVPIFKRKGKSSDPVNYRPVSLTAACCRLFETLLKESIVGFLDEHSLISDAQHGFRKKKSTLTNTLVGMLEWFSALEAGDVIHSVFLDFAKAFDTVSHPKLLHKLEAYGISGKLLNWIGAFLTGRTQCVRVEDSLSSEVAVSSGVPQGSVLGPILFLIYVNDLVDVTSGTSCSLFADDAKVSIRCSKTSMADPHLALALKNIHEWSKKWQIAFSLPKCQVFCFGTPDSLPLYEIGGVALETVTDVKDLGVFLSKTGKSSYHCTEVAKKGLAKVAHIFRCFRTRNRKFLLDMFRIYVRPIVEYNSPVWSPYLKKDIKSIERVQRTFTKRIPGLRDLSYKQRLDALGLKSLEEMRMRNDLVLAFRMLKNKVDLNFDDFFSLSPETRTRGHRYKLTIPFSRLDTVKGSFAHRVPALWNSLPAEVVEVNSVEAFKQKLKSVNLEIFLKGQD